MSYPRLGMRFEDVRTRVKRIIKNPGDDTQKARLVGSLLNQCRLAEGEGATKTIESEISQRPSGFSGAGTKQVGMGPGRKFGDGTWRYENGSWRRLE